MEHSKLQIGCLIIVCYVIFMYRKEKSAYKVQKKDVLFEILLIAGVISIILDGVTAYTVNHLTQIPLWVNHFLHMCFLCSLDLIVFIMFLYIMDITRGIPKKKRYKFLLGIPLILNLLIVICFIPELSYCSGKVTNYSMGISAYTCFVMVAVYMLATIVMLLIYWKNLGRHKMITILTYMLVTMTVALYQSLHPQALISCLFATISIIGAYLNMENPVLLRLQAYNREMVMGFATLVENRDGSTGGHIKRTTEYVRILSEELRRRGFYKEELTKDYIKNLMMAAPMHDVGKIAIPDAILQKPGSLTNEEYEIMKTHAKKGSDIIRDTFGHMGDDVYEKMAYEVAKYHHEKWNGKGYPEGLSKKEIPLCARIMAVADVFDAVSADRCYRKALPLEECFRIMEAGQGTDFDPVIVYVFLDMKEQIVEVLEKEK